MRLLAIAAIVLLLGTRALYFALEDPPPLLGDLVFLELHVSFLLGVVGALAAGLLAAAVVVLVVLRARSLGRVVDGRWAAAPWLHSAIWLVILSESWTLDLNPELTWVGALSGLWVAAIVPVARRWGGPRADVLSVLLVAVFFAVAISLAEDAADAFGILVWGCLLVLLLLLSRRVALRDRMWIAAGFLGAIQLGVSALPLVLRLHDGRHLAQGMAYSFCEASGRDRLYAAVPGCRADQFGERLLACRGGYIEEIDTRAPELVRVHRFFDDRFYGRLEQLACVGDTVHVGMENTMLDGVVRREHVIELSMDAPHRLDRDPLEGRGGARIVHDESTESLYYITAFSNRFLRRDLETGVVSPVLRHAGFAQGSTSAALHRGRERLLVLGSDREPVFAFDLDTLEIVARYPQLLGIEISVDEELDRLFVSGFWGLEVYDLSSGRRIAKRRLGFVGRQAAISKEHDLVFVPTFFEGKLRVFHRRTLEPLGKIPIGMYVRYPHVSADERFLFASSGRAHYFWDLEEIARRFGAP